MAANPVTLSLPANVASAIPHMAQRLTDRMHALLERNTDGQLTGIEREKRDALVEVAQFAQMIAAALDAA